jgi:hypothetical protein
VVQSQFGQIVCETLSWKTPSQKRAGGVAEGVGPEFKPQCWKKKKIRILCLNCRIKIFLKLFFPVTFSYSHLKRLLKISNWFTYTTSYIPWNILISVIYIMFEVMYMSIINQPFQSTRNIWT